MQYSLVFTFLVILEGPFLTPEEKRVCLRGKMRQAIHPLPPPPPPTYQPGSAHAPHSLNIYYNIKHHINKAVKFLVALSKYAKLAIVEEAFVRYVLAKNVSNRQFFVLNNSLGKMSSCVALATFTILKENAVKRKC